MQFFLLSCSFSYLISRYSFLRETLYLGYVNLQPLGFPFTYLTTLCLPLIPVSFGVLGIHSEVLFSFHSAYCLADVIYSLQLPCVNYFKMYISLIEQISILSAFYVPSISPPGRQTGSLPCGANSPSITFKARFLSGVLNPCFHCLLEMNVTQSEC